jgi:hypothetical protein
MSSARKVNVALAVCALVAGFCATLGVLIVLRSRPATAPHGMGAVVLPSAARADGAGGGSQPSPAALDAQWLGYSDRSTCADWAGGDGVSAIRLNSSQIAWFFADTYLGPAGPSIGFSQLSGFVHNSVVMQTTARHGSRLVTLTGGGACSGPGDPGTGAQSVVQPPAAGSAQREWDADGLLVGGTVVKFYNAYQPGLIPFVPVGTTIASFPASVLSADGHGPAYGGVLRPELAQVPSYTPPGGGTPIIWGSALLQAGPGGRTVYVYGWQSPDPSSPVRELYLARVSAARLADFADWQFYDDGQWASGQDLAAPIASSGQDSQGLDVPAGFSVVHIAGRYWLIQAAGAGDPDIDAYPAPAPWGPFGWGQGIVLYHAPGIGLSAADDYRILYEARAEPALSTRSTLVISYNVNSEAVTAGCVSIARYTNAITQPRFIAVPRSAFRLAGGSADPAVAGPAVAGPAAYPAITQQDPGQWFSAWSFPDGCPPVPAVSGATAQPGAAGTARLTWHSAGLNVRYRVYLATAPGTWAEVRTVSAPGVTVTGLTSGLDYEFEIVPVNAFQSTGAAAFVTARAG